MSGQSELGVNPKDALGVKKPSLSKIPPIALVHESLAMMDGGGKYGPYNWREKKILLSVYVDAMLRHLLAYWSGENYAEDSGCHHLGHLRACAGILLDALATGNLIDDRPVNAEAFSSAMKEVMDKMPAMFERHKEFKAKQEEQKVVITFVPQLPVVPTMPTWPYSQPQYSQPLQTSDPLPKPATITCNNSSEEIPF